MIKDLFNAIAIALNDEFDSPLLSIEDIEQNLTPPCFVLRERETTYRPRAHSMRRIDVPVEVLYFPVAERPREECMDIKQRAFSALECVTDTRGLGYTARDVSAELIDSVLHIYATYSVWYGHKDSTPVMENLDEDIRGCQWQKI